MKADPKRVTEANAQLQAAVADFIKHAEKGDVKGMLERGVFVMEKLQRVTEVITGTELAQ